MNTLFSCDDVFRELTAGPVAANSQEAEELQQHLLACVECSQLAEALRPARHLLHEAMSEAERKNLPVYDASPERLNAIMDEVRGVGQKQFDNQSRWSSTFWPTVAAGLACLLALPWLMSESDGSSITHDTARLLAAIPEECVPADVASQLLASLERNNATRGERTDDGSRSVARLEEYCCTECHSVGSSRCRLTVSVGQLVASCGICH